ncbi:hypothetical protein Tco_0260268 [Tanacetum coccineum]
MQQPMQNLEDSSDLTIAMNMALALLAKAFKVNTIPINNNQRSSLIPHNSQIAQPGMNTSQDIKMKMVDDNVGNQYGNGNVVTGSAEGNGNGINDAYEETERVKVNCTSEDTLQQASTSGTQFDNTPVYDSDGSTEVPKDEKFYDHDIFNMLTYEVQYTDLQTELDRTKEKLENFIIKKEKEYDVLWNIWTNPSKTSRVDNVVPNKTIKTSIRIKPITVSQPHVITKEDVNSNTRGFSPKDIDSTTRTRRPQSKNNPKNARVPYKSKSSCLSNKLEKIEENHRSLQPSNYSDHTSSECNNIKLAIRNEKSEVICATCKQCLITANHDECVLQYVNGMKSRKKNQSANVSKSENQKKHKANVEKSNKSGSKESLASPSKPRSFLRWLPTGRIFDLCGKITSSSNTESEYDTSVCDNASASNPQEPTNKGFPSSTSFIDRFTRLPRQNTCIHPLVVL